MRAFGLLPVLLVFVGFCAQAPESQPVPLAGEPHHHLKIENSYVRAYYVEVAPHESTLLHQHDLDYLFVILGPADIINAVEGKPELHQVLKDGEVHFARGGFAHVARNLSDAPFRNVTIEFRHPQENPRNITREIIPGPLHPPIHFQEGGIPGVGGMFLLFETDEVLVEEFSVTPKGNPVEPRLSSAGLLVALGDSGLVARVSGQALTKLAAGGLAWLPPGKWTISAPRGAALHFLLLSFKDSASAAAPKP